MTKKQITKLALNDRTMYLLSRINEENSQLIHKTMYEKETSINKIKEWTNEIYKIINN